MKFVLEPDNRGADDDVLFRNLREVASKLGKDYVTQDEYDKHGRWCSATFMKRFGSWTKAHERAGLRKIYHYDASREDCIKELIRVAAQLDTQTLTKSQYSEYGNLSDYLIVRRCGSWNAAVQQAGLSSPHPYPKGIPNEELFRNLEHVWESLGRQPKITDLRKPLSEYSGASYRTRFGSFRKALEAFVASLDDQDGARSDAPVAEPHSVRASIPHGKSHRTSRAVSWRTRFLVMRRDNFKCCICGVSPAMKPGTVLVVDHVFPWIEGGETVMENLQTLCEPCNGGKSDLPMQEE